VKLRILYIGDGPDKWFARWLEGWKEPDTVIETCGFGSNARQVEHAFKEHLAADAVIRHSVAAERDGFDAVVIGCFFDPGLCEARELVRIPVVGVCEASLHVAATLSAGKFSVLVPRRKSIPRMSENARSYGLGSKIASWRILGLTMSGMIDRERTQCAILREARIAVEQDLAETVCLGCTAMAGQAKDVQEALGVPVLDPVLVGLKVAESRGTLWKRFGISHSKIGGYETPPSDEFMPVLEQASSPAPATKKIGQLIRRIKP
jgi:allantoin racemase